MSLGRQRNHAVALTLAFAASLLSACSGLSDRLGQADETAKLVTTSGPWETIDGGILEGNRLTGLEYVRFERPVAVAVRAQWLYVADGDLDKLYRYDLGMRRLEQVLDLRTVSSADISDLYVASDFSYYIADPQGARVVHYSPAGTVIEEFSDPVNIGRPVAIHVDEARGWLYIADAFNDDVMVFNQAGGMIGVIGQRGDGPGRFRRITGLAVGSLGDYVATRFGTHRVQVFNPDGTYRTALQKDTVTFPRAIAADRYDRAFVADYLDDTIRVYDGTRLVETLGHHGAAPGQFKRITDLWLDGGRLFVADSLNGRIQILTLPASGPILH